MATDQLTATTKNLPSTLPELSKFALIGREKLASVRAEIRAIQKVGLAKEVLEQKRAEAQEIAELVTLSEVRIGAMLKEIPSTQGKRNDLTSSRRGDEVGKRETTDELGFSRNQVSQFQRMAEHEDAVLDAIAEARENDDVVTRSAVLKKIDEVTHKPHVANNSGNNEWYTPSEYIEAARKAMGSIDLDPATSEFANGTVKAATIYTAETNGLDKTWHGNVWLNPPYSSDLIGKFVDKLIAERDNYEQAIVLVNNATETEWFFRLVIHASAVCFTRGRVRYYTKEGTKNTPLQGQALVYIGDNPERFLNAFSKLGWGCYPAWNTQT